MLNEEKNDMVPEQGQNESVPETQPVTAPQPKKLKSISDLSGDCHKIIVMGGSRVGKSSIINAILSSAVTRSDLSYPAPTADSRVSNGTTDRVIAYNAPPNHVVIDTIGITDPRFTEDQILESLYEVLFNFRLGVSLVLIVVKHDIFSAEERDLIDVYEKLFGRDFYGRSCLIVSHYDNPVTDVASYVQREHSPAFQEFLRKFPVNRIIIGSFQQDLDPEIDNLLMKRREIFKENILKALNQYSGTESMLNFRGSTLFFKDFINYIWSYFKLHGKNDWRQRFFQAFVETNKAADLKFHSYECPICLECVDNDVMVTKCYHVYHFDCLRVNLLTDKNCPLCRQPIQTFIVLPDKSPSANASSSEKEMEEL